MDIASSVRKRADSPPLSPRSAPRPKRLKNTQSHRQRPASRDDFRVAIFCALPTEAAAVRAVLDHCWDSDGGAPYGQASGDQNAYTAGMVGEHNVILVHMPGMGKSHAAKSAANCLHSFPNIAIALLVGICGGVPSGPSGGAREMILGDVVVSDYVVQYDFGRQFPNGLRIKNTGVDSLERPNDKIRACISKIRSDAAVPAELTQHLASLGGLATYPGAANDKLFAPTYHHNHQHQDTSASYAGCHNPIGASCDELGCDESNVISRARLNGGDSNHHIPSIHYGTYASGDLVMRSGEDRDKIAKGLDAIAFEMEAPGVWQSFPGQTLVIKGVCDYADSHKNKLWQKYAAVTAAAYMTLFLSYWTSEVQPSPAAPERDILQDEENQKCLSDLRLTDPSVDKLRIERTKGGLFQDASKWVLTHHDFHQWQESADSRLLWIKGDPGKGKTMLLITIINELQLRAQQTENMGQAGPISYFFCQGTDKNRNHGTSVLCGLLYLLILQHPPLITHLRVKYDHSGARLFEDGNSFFALSQILQSMLQDQNRPSVALIIDALDECSDDQEHLLNLVSESVGIYPQAKWIVSSRNIPRIETHLAITDSGIKMVLEIRENANHITQAVDAYIDFQVHKLRSMSYHDPQRVQVRDILREKANGTFLWVALAIEEVQKSEPWDILDDLKKLPPGLDNLYKQMLSQVQGLREDTWKLCRRILSAVILAYRPLHITELGVLSEMPENICHNMENMKRIVALCGSFLATQSDDIVYTVHQSAADYLNNGAAGVIFPSGRVHVHRTFALQSLHAMTATLRQNIYELPHPGSPCAKRRPEQDPLLAVRYSSVHWVDHFGQTSPIDSSDVSSIHNFLQSKFLNWLEALCLLESLPEGLLSLLKLKSLLELVPEHEEVLDLVQDALRFAQHAMLCIINFPLQTYASALLFCPENSTIRQLYQDDQPNWVLRPPGMPRNWSTWEQTLEGHEGGVTSIAFSPDGTRLASGSWDKTVRIWRTDIGLCEQVLEGHTRGVMRVAFSPSGTQIVSGSMDGTVRIWRIDEGGLYKCEKVLEDFGSTVVSVDLSSDGAQFIVGHRDGTVQIWRSDASLCEKELRSQHHFVRQATFSPNDTRFAIAGSNVLDRAGTVEIWRTESGVYDREWVFESASLSPFVAFAPDGLRCVLRYSWDTFHLCRADTGACEQILEIGSYAEDAAFSPDGSLLAFAIHGPIQIWRAENGVYKHDPALNRYALRADSLAFSPDSAWLASGHEDGAIRVWRVEAGILEGSPKGHSKPVTSVALSPDDLWLASASTDKTIRIWRVDTGVCEKTLEIQSKFDIEVVFSPNGMWLAAASDEDVIRVWRVRGWVCEQIIHARQERDIFPWSLCFSPDSMSLAWMSDGGSVREWCLGTGVKQILRCTGIWVESMAFSPDCQRLAIAQGMEHPDVGIWNLRTRVCEQTVPLQNDAPLCISFSPDGKQLRTGRSTMCGSSGTRAEVYYGGFDLSEDGRWVTWNGISVLLLPAEYRPSCSTISGSRIALGLDSGLAIILTFDPQLMAAIAAKALSQGCPREEWEKRIVDIPPLEGASGEEAPEQDG